MKLLALAVIALAAHAAGIRGAALHAGEIITWGDELRAWRIGSLQSRLLAARPVQRGEGGCILDAGRRNWAIVLEEDHNLVLRRAPRFAPEILDTNVEMHDCASATLFGESVLLVVQRFAQLRAYRKPAKSGPWPYREVYSIYTPSREGGLLVTEFGVISGNYWFRIPPEPDRPWREFAINTWSETPDSAILRFARIGSDLIVAQAHMPAARLSRFTPHSDVTQLWNEQRLAADLRYPHALAAEGDQFVVGENAGPGSRLLLYRGNQPRHLIATTNGTVAAFIIGGEIYAVDREKVFKAGDGQLRSSSPPGPSPTPGAR